MAVQWDILGKASILVQLLGLDAITFVTIATKSFLQLRDIKKEFRNLEDSVWLLRSLRTGCRITTQQEHFLTCALRDAQCLVASYNASTLFMRVRRGRSMARQFHDLHSRIDYYCGLILTVNACLLIVQVNPPPTAVVREEVDGGDVASSAGYSTDAQISSADRNDIHIIDVGQE